MKKYNFPKELTEKKQWVNVTEKLARDPNTKDLRWSNLNNSSTWGTYEQVLQNEHYEDENHIDKHTDIGIGYVFCEGEDIIGVDIDSGIYDNGIMNDFGVEITNLLSSYTEWSSSRRGTHIFIKANFDFEELANVKENYKCEIYNYRRMFQMTGDALIDCPIQERQKELEYLISKYFLEGLKHAEVVEEKDDLIKKYYHPNQEEMTYTQILGGMRKETILSLCYKNLLTNKSKSDILDIMKKENEKCIPKLSNKEIEEIYELGLSYIERE